MNTSESRARIDDLIFQLQEMRRRSLEGGGPDAVQRHRQAGKMTARERVEALLDRESFVELDPFILHRATEFEMDKRRIHGDGVITGFGRINGRLVAVYAHDATVLAGTMGEMHAIKIARLLDKAIELGVPVIALSDSPGARVQEGVAALNAIAECMSRIISASGFIPQISVIMGSCAGGAAFSAALGDFVIMVDKISSLFYTGPRVVKIVTGEDVTIEQLGGSEVHAKTSGTADFKVSSEAEALMLVRKLLSYLPSNCHEQPPSLESQDLAERMDEELNYMIPAVSQMNYDMQEVLSRVFDRESFIEVKRDFAPNAITGFARLAGDVVGVVANQPMYMNGALDVDASDKIARFVRFCNCFNIPIITFVDVPGHQPGSKQEQAGLLRHGAKVLYAYAEATVPKVSVIVRRAYAGGYISLASKGIGIDIVYAYPTAEIAALIPEAAVEVVFRKEIETTEPSKRGEKIAQLIEEYRVRITNPYVAASLGYVDDVIEPKETRPRLVKALRTLKNKKAVTPNISKKHGNIPL